VTGLCAVKETKSEVMRKCNWHGAILACMSALGTSHVSGCRIAQTAGDATTKVPAILSPHESPDLRRGKGDRNVLGLWLLLARAG